MNAHLVNARVILPVTSYDRLIRGYPIDAVFYANNYEDTDTEHPVIERFSSASEALNVFSEGKVMSKGTTTSTGIVKSYFANIFGPPEYRELHDKIAARYFEAFFSKGIFVGQMRTKLGIAGHETSGPREAAAELLKVITNYKS